MDKALATPVDLSGGKALLAGGVAALLASACCLAPLVLVLLLAALGFPLIAPWFY